MHSLWVALPKSISLKHKPESFLKKRKKKRFYQKKIASVGRKTHVRKRAEGGTVFPYPAARPLLP